jgi:long-chain acyl-CoA synthetase
MPPMETELSKERGIEHAIHGAAPLPRPRQTGDGDWWGTCVEEYHAAGKGGGAFATAEAG